MTGGIGMRTPSGIVYQDSAMYAGWPANHGAWQRGDEFLVGFLRGPYTAANRMHHIGRPFGYMLARSLDGGYSWTTEGPWDFEAEVVSTGPGTAFDLRQTIFRVSGVYDHGGDNTTSEGAFYASRDFGKTWTGPYLFPGLSDMWEGRKYLNTSRTRYLVGPTGSGLFFMSKGLEAIWGTDEVFAATYLRGRFQFLSTVLADEARAVMPAVVSLPDGRIVCAMRRRKSGVREGWIDYCLSDDFGKTWSKPYRVGTAGSHNGNPPALAVLPDGLLVCCYGDRDSGSLLATSFYPGDMKTARTWTVAGGGKPDIGYPQLFVRKDGTPVVVYYWATKGGGRGDGRQHIRWAEVDPSLSL